jgi:sugar (pentulose or hexulose) kinase
MSKLILGLDMGTTSISAVALNEAGRVIHAVTQTHHAAIEGLPSDYAEQNPERIRATAFAALKNLSELCRGYEFQAIALTGQMHSTGVLSHSHS